MSVMTEPLFDRTLADGDLTPIPPGISAGRRRTLRRLQMIELGTHPISRLPISAAAPEDASRRDRFLRQFTCGTCAHRFVMMAGRKVYPRCDLLSDETVEKHSAVTDTPRWMPARIDWLPALLAH